MTGSGATATVPVRERIGDIPDAPVVVRSPDPARGFAIPTPDFAALEAADEGAARAVVRREVESAGFLSFASGTPRAGERAIALVSAARREALGFGGGGARVVRLSAETVRAHPRFRDFATEEWLRVRRIVDEGSAVGDGRQASRLFWIEEDEGRPWLAAIKETRNGRQLYAASLRRTSEVDIARLRRVRGR